jgi:hypothetical protein
MTDFNTALMQHIFHTPKRKWKSNIHHYRKTNDLRRCLEIAKRTAFCHPQMLGACPARFNPVSSDSARLAVFVSCQCRWTL